jgi:hypothetical protein
MHAGTGLDRIVDDVASARASFVTFSPALFVNGQQYRGELDPAAVSAARCTRAPDEGMCRDQRAVLDPGDN